LTGGIGSGKSTVARYFGELGAVVLDADTIARELLGPGGEGAKAVVEAFGTEVASKDGSIDRAKLAGLVFADDGAREKLEAILHPMILAKRRGKLAEIRRARGDSTIVVTEASLIFEAGTREEFDSVVLVSAPVAARRSRLLAAGWDAGDIEARMKAQWPDSRKRPLADFVIDNRGDAETLREMAKLVWEKLSGWPGRPAGTG